MNDLPAQRSARLGKPVSRASASASDGGALGQRWRDGFLKEEALALLAEVQCCGRCFLLRSNVDVEVLVRVGFEGGVDGDADVEGGHAPEIVVVTACAPSRNSLGMPVTGCGVLSHLAASPHLRKYSAWISM